MRVPLPEGDHTLRLGFIDDPFVKTLAKEDIYKDTVNKWIGVGDGRRARSRRKGEKPSRKKILVCDPKTGAVCVDRILVDAGAPRLPPAGDRRRSRGADEVRHAGEGRRPVGRAGHRARDPGDARLAALPVPHRARSRTRTIRRRVHRISDVELASRLSYFLWNSMPDDELLSLAERRQLSAPEVLDAQVKRMLADPKASAMAENFAGQWLEIRNLDSIKPDPQKFPAWRPELRDAMKTETRMFFDCDPAREPSDRRVHRRALHVPQRVPRELLRHRRRDRAGVPARRAHDRRARRRAEPRQRARRLELSDAHVGRHSRQVHPAEHPRARRRRRRRRTCRRSTSRPSAPRPRCASRWRRTAPTPSARRATRAWIRSASRSRTTTRSASGGRMDGELPGGFERRAAGRQDVLEPGRDARRFSASVLPEFSRTLTEKMLIYALGRGLERYDRPTVQRHHEAAGRPPATASRRSCARSCAACRSSRAAPKPRRRSSRWSRRKPVH